MNKSKVIFILSFILVGIGTFVIINVRNHYHYVHSKKIGRNDFIDSVILISENTNIRGVIYIKGIGYMSVRSKLVQNPQNYKGWRYDGAIVSFENSKPIHIINDLSFPYLVYKKPNDDTLLVRKDSFYLYFKLKPLE